jgi:hypothetical protein
MQGVIQQLNIALPCLAADQQKIKKLTLWPWIIEATLKES